MLAPILVFTADEAWGFIPGAGGESVHLTEWKPSGLPLAGEEELRWKQLFELREQILPALEKERQAKTIGKGLDAKVTLAGVGKILPGANGRDEEILRELVNVSQLDLCADAGAAALTITVSKAEGAKCERCWHWELDTGANAAHPTLCGRCARAIADTAA
jgi:isoleucyl-tRNA synthetase